MTYFLIVFFVTIIVIAAIRWWIDNHARRVTPEPKPVEAVDLDNPYSFKCACGHPTHAHTSSYCFKTGCACFVGQKSLLALYAESRKRVADQPTIVELRSEIRTLKRELAESKAKQYPQDRV